MHPQHLDYGALPRPAERRLRRRAALGVACAVLLTLATGAALVGWVMNAPAVPRSSLARLSSGMSAQEVTQLLGTPDSTSVEPDGSQAWTYSRMTWAYLTIDFDANQTVTAFNHDE